MKPLDVAKELNKMEQVEHLKSMLISTILQQIAVLERLIEHSADKVESPISYNVVVGLMSQLKYYTPAIFMSAEENVNRLINEYDHNQAMKSKSLL